ncbi:hypothetical protein PIB30_090488 [Stylosanthes scabra]|uniref:Uncharacterized protein n=1 Tax=Stylosanthes scabra TaxID=79078 RepID=A0ABU6RV85_9FABA|nr:hypothetical protein [Stylosanthes scabra]
MLNNEEAKAAKICSQQGKGSLRSKKRRNWSILDRAPTPWHGDSGLGVQNSCSGPKPPRLGMDANA